MGTRNFLCHVVKTPIEDSSGDAIVQTLRGFSHSELAYLCVVRALDKSIIKQITGVMFDYALNERVPMMEWDEMGRP